jgi:ATPase subunit of ABC transporter with duplicated ATPase domains
LTSVLQNNQAVSIEVKLFGEDWEGIEEELRGILQCQAPFDKDIEDLEDIYQENGVRGIEKLKEAIKGIRNGERDAKDKRFTKHLKSLTQESVIDLILWFPRDDLKITFGPNRQPIEQSSPGQRNAALLAFILSYGDEPLLLDQPEDDLDNELIYSLIVRQLRETKSRRQVIVVTHNANIVVNGDAEMVLPLKVECGATRVRQAASVQIKEVREAICDILEGGQQAFEQRYKRIHLGD